MGGNQNYHSHDCVGRLRALEVTPHMAMNHIPQLAPDR